jgi:predicted ATPase
MIGREQEEDAVRTLLLRGSVRLLTLVGPPGIGKTRLGIAVATDLLEHFPDGVYFVGVAPVREPEMVIPAIANTLAVRESGGQSLRDTLLGFLQGKRVLLLLDNFEQVLDAGTDIVTLLEGSPWLRVLVTSREALHVRGERPYVVPPLPLPDLSNVETLLENPAAALFMQRAQAANPAFELTQDNAQAVAAVCVGLDGLPLAIELAAARANLLTPAQILAALDHRLGVLVEGWRDMPPRHQTLRNAIGWSYDLLDPEEQALFARLGVFVGGCAFDAIAECGVRSVDFGLGRTDAGPEIRTPHSALRNQLASLIAKNLLKQEATPEGTTRFTMLETIREYALERLYASGEAEDVQQRHATHYLTFTEAAERERNGAQQTTWLTRLDLDYSNLGAALEWAFRKGDAQTALRLASALYWYWDTRNLMSEGRRWLEATVQMGDSKPDALRAHALFGAGTLAFWQTDHDRAQSALEESLAVYRAIGDKEGIAEALDMLGLLARERGDNAESIRLHEESLPLRQQVGDRRGIAYTLSQLGKSALRAGDYEAATRYFTDGLALRREIGNTNGIAASLNMLGWTMVHQGKYSEACSYFGEGLRVCRQLGDKHIEASMLKGMGYARLLQSEQTDPTVRGLFEQSLESFRIIGDKVNMIEGLETFAVLASAHSEQLEEAKRGARLFGAAEALRNTMGIPLSHPNQLLYEPLMHQARNRLGEAPFNELMEEGRRMTMEEAISYAVARQLEDQVED